jgi:hypothetical protein
VVKFYVDRLVDMEVGRVTVAGRCETSLRLGDRFLYSAHYTAKLSGEIVYMTLVGSVGINCSVEKITSYRHEFEELNAGMTALVVLSGDVEKIVNNTTLSSTPPIASMDSGQSALASERYSTITARVLESGKKE